MANKSDAAFDRLKQRLIQKHTAAAQTEAAAREASRPETTKDYMSFDEVEDAETASDARAPLVSQTDK